MRVLSRSKKTAARFMGVHPCKTRGPRARCRRHYFGKGDYPAGRRGGKEATRGMKGFVLVARASRPCEFEKQDAGETPVLWKSARASGLRREGYWRWPSRQ